MTLLAVLLFAAIPASLESVKAEPDLEKRSELALEYAKKVLKDARTAYDDGKMEDVKAQIGNAQAAVDIAMKALADTGKNPRKNSKYFKKAEIRTRDLLRDSDSFSQHMSYADRPLLETLHKNLHEANDELVRGIMGMK